MLALSSVLPRQGEVARRSRDGGGGYDEAHVCGDAPSTTRLWRAVLSRDPTAGERITARAWLEREREADAAGPT